jgi:hypothetical protein
MAIQSMTRYDRCPASLRVSQVQGSVPPKAQAAEGGRKAAGEPEERMGPNDMAMNGFTTTGGESRKWEWDRERESTMGEARASWLWAFRNAHPEIKIVTPIFSVDERWQGDLGGPLRRSVNEPLILRDPRLMTWGFCFCDRDHM